MFIALISVLGCGGASDSPDRIEPPAEDNRNQPMTILDSFLVQDSSTNTFFGKSSVSSSEAASHFELESQGIVTGVNWIGTADFVGEQHQATFILRVYEGERLPQANHIREKVEVVNMELVRSYHRNGKRGVYIFSLSGDPVFSLTSGKYWISVMDPETEAIDFFWEIEPGTAGGSKGSGGAYRSIGGAWTSNSGDFPALQARGHNIEIIGVLE